MSFYHSTGHTVAFDRTVLQLDLAAETERLISFLASAVNQQLARRGAVVGIDGSVNSALALALCVGSFGPDFSMGLVLHEQESNPQLRAEAERLQAQFGAPIVSEDITPVLGALGCYEARDQLLGGIFPDYRPGWHIQVCTPGSAIEPAKSNGFSVAVCSPEGRRYTAPVSFRDYIQLLATSTMKRRVLMTMLYRQAELHDYAVVGSASRDEWELGLAVKHGDAGVDVSPLAHLFQCQVMELAGFLDIPGAAGPTLADRSLAHVFEEDSPLRLPVDTLDLIWYGYELSVPDQRIASALDLSELEVSEAILALIRKQRTARYLHAPTVRLDSAMSGPDPCHG